MKKTSKFSMFLFFSALSVLIAFAVYYQLDRYLWLCSVKPSDKKVENYKNLPKVDDKKVVISLTLTPEELEKNTKMLNSILDQTVKVDQILLNIPPTDKEYKIPDIYKKTTTINKLGKKYDDNILPTLLREVDSDSKIIYLDSNYIFGKDFIQTMLEESNKNNDCILKNKNVILLKPEFFKTDFGLNNVKTKNVEYNENFKY
jgi:hypothetical protein